MQGDADAQRCLGFCYHKGNGVEQDYEKAVYWFEKAAMQGDAGAQYFLGIGYQYGQWIEKDYNKALYWYEKAAAQGHQNAMVHLTDLKNNMKKE